jgi:hypothetical protein
MTAGLTELQTIRRDLASNPRGLDEIWQSRPLLWQRLGWDRSQLRLWLRCLPDMQVSQADTDEPGYRIGGGTESQADDLSEIIAKVLESVGKPLPLAALRAKLPPGTVVTDPMLRAAIQSHPELTMTGPLVRLTRRS